MDDCSTIAITLAAAAQHCTVREAMDDLDELGTLTNRLLSRELVQQEAGPRFSAAQVSKATCLEIWVKFKKSSTVTTYRLFELDRLLETAIFEE